MIGYRKRLILLLSFVLVTQVLCMLSLSTSERSVSRTVFYRPQRTVPSPICILGTDADGLRTDVIMLLGVQSSAPVLLSVPRDTLVQTDHGAEKLNAVYAVHGGGSEGLSALYGVLDNQLEISAKRYILLDLAAFEQLVNAIGGIWFDVPTSMHYSDPTQNLQIDLSPGYQKLSGSQALGLVRYRNYFLGDIDRIQVQQSILMTAAKQLRSDISPSRLFQLAKLFDRYVQTDLNFTEIVNLALYLSSCDLSQAAFGTLPGDGKMIDGVDYYRLYDEEAKAMILKMFS